jgi:hypothetical protein
VSVAAPNGFANVFEVSSAGGEEASVGETLSEIEADGVSTAVMRAESCGAEPLFRTGADGFIGKKTFQRSKTPIARAMARKARRSCLGSSATLPS